ncbi:Lrp/AsnC family transcriptional regulator [Candidatus Micrarchaeota archaeon]|nr:Lrp/AsnC family transcriptional regulator [Candidatus Micrarchaeota archaeon]
MDTDGTDEKILEALKQDSRISYTDLAKDLDLSDVAVKKRIDKLTSGKVIKNFTINLDYKQINKPVHAFILVKCVPSDAEKFREFVKENTEIIRVLPSIGEYDYIIEAATKDVESLRKLAEENLGNVRGVLQVRTLLVV